jgi:transporter family-2 protein
MASLYATGLALLTGVALVLQPVANSRLASLLGATLWAAGVSATFTAILIFASATVLSGAPHLDDLFGRSSWLSWMGGVLGAVSLVGLTYSMPRIGAAAMLVLVVAAQTVTAFVVDRSGLLETPAPISPGRVIGAMLVLGGVTLFSLSSSS